MSRQCLVWPIGFSQDQYDAAIKGRQLDDAYSEVIMYDVFNTLLFDFRDQPEIDRVVEAMFIADGSNSPEDDALPPLELAVRLRELADFWTNRTTLQQEISARLLEDGWWYREEYQIEDLEKFELFRLEMAKEIRGMARDCELFAAAGATKVTIPMSR